MCIKAIWFVTLFLFQLPLVTAQEDTPPERERRNPDDLAPREETDFNPDGTIRRIKPLPDGRVEVDGKILSRQELEARRKKLQENFDPSLPRAKIGAAADGQPSPPQADSSRPLWQVITVVVFGVVVTLGIIWAGFRKSRRT